MVHNFFDYPDPESESAVQELVVLAHWDEARWGRLLQYTSLRRFQAGDFVIRAGDSDRTLFFIIEGRLELLFGDSTGGSLRPRGVVPTGAVIGEQAFMDGKPRSAHLRALDDGKLMGLSHEAFDVLAAREPDLARDLLLELGRILSVRLRMANAFIAQRLK